MRIMGSVTISYGEFNDLIASRTEQYFRVVGYLANRTDSNQLLTRPILGELLSQSTQIEEFLDSYGARNNCQWAYFRSLTATIKLFSNVSYELLHIQHSIPAYRLLGVKREFSISTGQTLSFTESILQRTAAQLMEEAENLNLPIPSVPEKKHFLVEKLPDGRLPHDLAMRKVEKVSKAVSMLATAFLNLSAESLKDLPCKKNQSKALLEAMTDFISEEKVRSLELRFHNLQSLYDTYVSTTEAEVLDNDLPVLRGHITVVLHLLRTARDFAHYYERHASDVAHKTAMTQEMSRSLELHDDSFGHEIAQRRNRLVDPEQLLERLVNYCVYFVGQFLGCAEQLCRNMLKRYTELGSVELVVPPYRGFHVRPSTLISKLVLHYGSEVKMILAEDAYDARSPLELFRANEKINAHKRRFLAKEIFRLDLLTPGSSCKCIESTIRNAVVELAESGKVIIYEHPLKIETSEHQANAKLAEQVSDAIAKLLLTGKIDIITSIRAVFTGNKRVLRDITLLAEHGYGEDSFGNNVSLPESLTYLR